MSVSSHACGRQEFLSQYLELIDELEHLFARQCILVCAGHVGWLDGHVKPWRLDGGSTVESATKKCFAGPWLSTIDFISRLSSHDPQ